jgi:hypothetical protein
LQNDSFFFSYQTFLPLSNFTSFLITPKLLPNLTTMEEEAMTILFVFNGAFNFRSPTDWRMESIIGSRGGQKRRAITGEEDEEENSMNSRPESSSTRNSKKSRRSR